MRVSKKPQATSRKPSQPKARAAVPVWYLTAPKVRSVANEADAPARCCHTAAVRAAKLPTSRQLTDNTTAVCECLYEWFKNLVALLPPSAHGSWLGGYKMPRMTAARTRIIVRNLSS